MLEWLTRRIAARDLKILSRRIEHRETIRRDFVANVSHELKTPITAIRGLVETLIGESDMESGTRVEFLKKIAAQNHRMADLVSDLMRLSKLESETESFQMSMIDCRSVVASSVQGMRDLARHRGIVLVTFISREPVSILADPESLRQLLDNLIQNAIQFSPNDGKIVIRLDRRENRAVLSVKDDGPGIEKKHLPRIFERFYRVDAGRSREIGGTGLGLAIVKHVAMMHQGTVAVDSTVGRGSVFTVNLPLL